MAKINWQIQAADTGICNSVGTHMVCVLPCVKIPSWFCCQGCIFLGHIILFPSSLSHFYTPDTHFQMHWRIFYTILPFSFPQCDFSQTLPSDPAFLLTTHFVSFACEDFQCSILSFHISLEPIKKRVSPNKFLQQYSIFTSPTISTSTDYLMSDTCTCTMFVCQGCTF